MKSFSPIGLFLFNHVLASCECGHTVRLQGLGTTLLTDSLETNFLNVTTLVGSPDWRTQIFNKSSNASRGPYGELFSPSTVLPASTVRSTGFQLVVGSKSVDGMIPSAEIATTRSDFLYGSYRASIKLPRDSGTCAAFYWYFNDTQEIDIEFLSKSFDFVRRVFPTNVVLHSNANLDPDYDAEEGGTWAVKNLPFDPTNGFHEYRFDWIPGLVTFYADGRVINQMSGDAVPNHPGHVLLSHWSNGDDKWSGGPPAKNASVSIRYFNAYFNSTDKARQADWQSRCSGSRLSATSVCRVTG
ncbi:concanavalin A-like lectin/glucanase [Thozetella sp. PMI_491]|nr:concanavalin A-like lectin/glucanase [Thozetella sp. PMI_491]